MLSGKTPPGEGSAKIPSQTPPVDAREVPGRSGHPASVDAHGAPGRSGHPATADARIVSKTRAELKHPSYFLNRELTWLNFNHRVLHEAEDPRTPLLERVKFLAIVGSNLDEFHMKRMGGLKQQVGAELAELSVDGRS